jgi:hypothetical protein
MRSKHPSFDSTCRACRIVSQVETFAIELSEVLRERGEAHETLAIAFRLGRMGAISTFLDMATDLARLIFLVRSV